MKAAFLFLLLVVSCFKEPTIDASTEESFKKSVQEIEKNLKGDELHKFQENIRFIEASHEDDKKEYRKRSNGKNTKEFAELLSLFVKEFNVMYFQSVIDGLVKKKADSDKINEEFNNLKISKVALKNRNDSTALITVENKTIYTISSLSFKGIISAPERKTIWAEKELFHNVPKGIEPGEKLSFEASMSRSPIWQKGSVPVGYELRISLAGVWDHERKRIFPDRTFGEKDLIELENARSALFELRGLK
jgi:hypothetical protein